MKRFLTFVVCAAFARAAAAEGVEQTVAETLKLLSDRGIQVDAAAAQKSIAVALARTADPGAEIVSEAEAKHRREELSGLDFTAGLRLSISNGLPLVIDVHADGPASKAGLAAGDVLLEIGGTNAFELTTLPDAIRATRRHGADRLEFRYRRGAHPSNSVPVTLALLKLPAIECAETLPNGIFYIKVNGLYPEAGAAIATALRGWTARSRSGVILDLRGSGGDHLESVQTVAGLFAKNGDVLFTVRDRRDQQLELVKAAGDKPLGVPVMVLVDRDTRGASELLAAVLSDSVKGAMVVGRTSHGDPLVREYLKLQSGDLLYVATKLVVTADGTRYDGRSGVKPDVQAGGLMQPEFDAEPVADRRALLDQELQDFALRNRVRGDAALRRAVDILLGLKALNIGSDDVRPGNT